MTLSFQPIRHLFCFALMLSVLSQGCKESTSTIQNRLRLNISPCLGPVENERGDASACSRSTIQRALAQDEANACVVVQQAESAPLRFRARLTENRLEGLLEQPLALDSTRPTRVSLFFFREAVSERLCRDTQLNDGCTETCLVKLADTLSGGQSGQTIEIDFQTRRDEGPACQFVWNEAVEPLVSEICDGLDNDCDGQVDEKVIDTVPETCDGTDNDCDGRVDEGLNAGQVDECDGVDNDCDGKIDENLSAQVEMCDGEDNDCDGQVDEGLTNAQSDVCDSVDNDCDGRIDEDVNADQPDLCDGEDSDCDGRIDEDVELDQVEVCDRQDNDCDGRVDESLAGRPDARCDGIDDDCDGQIDEDAQGLAEVCDDVDNDCDGDIDEQLSCCRDESDCDGQTTACVAGQCEECDPERPLQTNLCPFDKPICQHDGSRPVCRACTDENECDDGQLCVQGRCVQCQVGSRIGCSEALPWCESVDGTPACVGCTTSDQCGEEAHCHRGACVGCVPGVAEHCPAVAPVCVNDGAEFLCRPCGDAAACADGLICLDGQCVECTLADRTGCAVDAPFCRRAPMDVGVPFQCSERCLHGGECQEAVPTTPACVEERCVACDPVSNQHCDRANRPRCKADGSGGFECAPCSDNQDCDGFGMHRKMCVTLGIRAGECAECITDEDCANGGYCIDNACAPCHPDGHRGCQSPSPRCAQRTGGQIGYECRRCDPMAGEADTGCSSHEVCIRLGDPEAEPTCQACDPVSGAGCIEDHLVCQQIGATTQCVGCLSDADDCHQGPYEGLGRLCLPNPQRPDINYQFCLECDVNLEVNGCGPDRPICVDGFCEVCDVRTSEGCDADTPSCLANAQVLTCEGCSDHLDCARVGASNRPAYCDFQSGRCRECPVAQLDVNPPDGCPENCNPDECAPDRPLCVFGLDGCVFCDPNSTGLGRYRCDGDLPICDATGQCVACENDEQCQSRPSGHPYCVDGRCEVCRPGTTIGCDRSSLGHCVDDPPRCVECVAAEDCSTNQCDAMTGKCVCLSDDECTDNQPICVQQGQGIGLCQPCAARDCDQPACMGATICQSCSAGRSSTDPPVGPGHETVDIRVNDERGSGAASAEYGCAENSATPICEDGRCRDCSDDAECVRRPGERNFCVSGRCAYCDENELCSVRLQLVARTEGERPQPYPYTYAYIRCGNENAEVSGADSDGRSVASVECAAGSEVELCCAVGDACFAEPPPRRVLESGWTVARPYSDYEPMLGPLFVNESNTRIQYRVPYRLGEDVPVDKVIQVHCVFVDAN
ncbi:MAG: MopE-related protein [Myxococcota bacterium]|nr:MopE-related protein [Myxococcota bacterium]